MTGPSLAIVSKGENLIMEKDMVKSLALKLLEVPLFGGLELQSDNFDTIIVYHTEVKIIQGTVQLPTNVAMREMKESFLVDGEEGIRRLPRQQRMPCNVARVA